MSNKKVSNGLRRTPVQPQRDDGKSGAKRTRKAARNPASTPSGADPAVAVLTQVMQHHAISGGHDRPNLTPSTLVKLGVATLLVTSGAQARSLLAAELAPVPAPLDWTPNAFAPRPAAAAPTSKRPAAAPSVPSVPYNPFVVARATQNADLLGDTRNATVFQRDGNGRPLIRPADVHQDIDGEGDCQTLSVFASVAEKNPALIENHLQRLGPDGKGGNLWAVTIFVDDKWTTYVKSDASLPGRGALQKCDVIWPRLLESAIIDAFPRDDVLNKALVNGSEPSSGKWAIDTGKVLHAVTGLPLKSGSGDEAVNALLEAVANGSPATAGVVSSPLNWFGSFLTVDAQTGLKVTTDAPKATTLLGAHQYAVLGAKGAAPSRQVTLFNSYNYPGTGGSTFTVSESVFRQFFNFGLAWT